MAGQQARMAEFFAAREQRIKEFRETGSKNASEAESDAESINNGEKARLRPPKEYGAR